MRIDRSGFTLVEAMVATLVVAVGVLCVVSMTRWSFQATHHTTRATLATHLAQSKIEEFRNRGGYEQMTSGQDARGEFTRAWTVSEAGSDIRRLDVVVSWDGLYGRRQAVSNLTCVKRW
jgi:Tfp pilus assembly protein PilV